MATTKRIHVFATCIISGIAAIFTIVSLSTEQWIYSNSIHLVNASIPTGEINSVKYGLFQGTFFQKTPATMTFQLSMTCRMQENICAVLCSGDSNILSTLYKGHEVDNPMLGCPLIHRSTSARNRLVTSYREYTDIAFSGSKSFINYGVWISSIIFLVLSLAFGVLASALAMFNTVNSPVQVFLSIHGLYIYNAIALFGSVLAMALWGIMHIFITYYNVAIYYTITGYMTSEKVAYLGFSYWINIIPVVLYGSSIIVLYVRQYLLSKDPGHQLVQKQEHADPVIYLY